MEPVIAKAPRFKLGLGKLEEPEARCRTPSICVTLVSMNDPDYRKAITDYVRANAKPPDKFSHQPRLYRLARQLADSRPYDDDVLFAAAWTHDLGVFVGHRPDEPEALAHWDNVAYAMRLAPQLLRQFGFPSDKIPKVVEVIRTHLPSTNPTSFEGILLRDADILEQLGAAGILRIVCKIGRDTRFVIFEDAIAVLRKNAAELPGRLLLDSARALAIPKLKVLRDFLEAAEAELANV
jgi:uncharacterized protein